MTRSPFPGMDPYLEAHWRDVHTSMMTYIRDQIQEQLPYDLVARVEETVSVDYEDSSRSIAPDVRVVEDFDVPSRSRRLPFQPSINAQPIRSVTRQTQFGHFLFGCRNPMQLEQRRRRSRRASFVSCLQTSC